MKDKMLWDKTHTACVRASKIRTIIIYPDRLSTIIDTYHTEVKGWFNENDHFDFGRFETEAEAQQFVKAINEQIEG
jgi:hypothetical protein